MNFKKCSNLIKIPIIASGGFGKLYIKELKEETNIDALTVSGAIHYNRFTLKDIKDYCIKIKLMLEIKFYLIINLLIKKLSYIFSCAGFQVVILTTKNWKKNNPIFKS